MAATVIKIQIHIPCFPNSLQYLKFTSQAPYYLSLHILSLLLSFTVVALRRQAVQGVRVTGKIHFACVQAG
jgi:hypothetical protein